MTERHRIPRLVRALLARRLARPAPARHPRQRRAVLYKVDRIGDFVLATGALRMLVNHFGPTNTRLVVSDDAAPYARLEFPDVACWTAPANATGLLRSMPRLRCQLGPAWAEEHYEHLVCLRHARSLYRDLSLTWLCGSAWHGLGTRPTPSRITLQNVPAAPAGYPAAAPPPWNRELLAHRAVVQSVLGHEPPWQDLHPRLTQVTVRTGPEIVLCPFGSDPIRDYPVEHWTAAVQRTVGAGQPVRVLGPVSRAAELHAYAARLSRAGVPSLATVDPPALEFLGHLAEARLVLTVESAAAHLAAALDKPAVIAVGGGHFGAFAPWGNGVRQRWVNHPLACYGCDWQCHRPTVECLVDLPVTAIERAILEVLPRA